MGKKKSAPVDSIQETPAPLPPWPDAPLLFNKETVGDFVQWVYRVEREIKNVVSLEGKRRRATNSEVRDRRAADVMSAAKRLVEANPQCPIACFGRAMVFRLGNTLSTLSTAALYLTHGSENDAEFLGFLDAAELLKDDLRTACRLAHRQLKLIDPNIGDSVSPYMESLIEELEVGGDEPKWIADMRANTAGGGRGEATGDGAVELQKAVASLVQQKKHAKPLTPTEKIRNQRNKFSCPLRRKKPPVKWMVIYVAYEEKLSKDKKMLKDDKAHDASLRLTHDRNCALCDLPPYKKLHCKKTTGR